MIVPVTGKPIAVIPEIGAAGMRATWIDDVRTWPAPQPDDDGVSLRADALRSVGGTFRRIGAEFGPQMVVRMPARDLQAVSNRITPTELVDATPVLNRIRSIKSHREIEKIDHICKIVSDSFEALPARLAIGMTEREACREMRLDVLQRGADGSPYMMGVAGHGGYDNIIMGPTDRPIGNGDVLIIDTGTIFDGYFCDFDRNFAFGPPDDAVRRAYDVVYQATDAGIAAARPGATTSDLFDAMMRVLEPGGSAGNSVGRLGHGLGLQLTEGPSNRPGDETILEPGMVLTIEPGMEFAPGRMMVHEEDIVITDAGCTLLTRRAPPEMPETEGRGTAS